MLSTYLPPGLSAKEIAERLVEEYESPEGDAGTDGQPLPLLIDDIVCDTTHTITVRRALADLIEHIRSER